MGIPVVERAPGAETRRQPWLVPPRLRTAADAPEERRATWLELFFDLVFVVAIAELTRQLVLDHSLSGFAEFAGLFVPVWVAWQGWRKGRASIFVATQQGNTMSKPAPAGTSTGNEWNPAIAADANGNVAVAWDSYRNGNYDVFMKRARGPGAWGKDIVVAASAKYDARDRTPDAAPDPGLGALVKRVTWDEWVQRLEATRSANAPLVQH